ncbi:MAG: flagellar basal body-associated FliL family protein [Pseudomonadota bacterium]
MADAEENTDVETKKGPGLKLWLAVIGLAVALGGGGFYATYSGLLLPSATPEEADQVMANIDPVRFVELDPLQISVGGDGSVQKLRFRAYLQVGASGPDPVEAVEPRILDIFATYLRALPTAVLEDPTALMRIRSQLLRRVQLLTGPDAVEDLLIIDFVIV